ncbi:DinB family protein [Bacillus sp. DNRA2]|uniref:DinB family protein n=1 Tax=Bacillus sp. DNRA2 TaxID=2723053 RepID=UPI00145C591F|nr:DinB family protein [Bacillus sp. DNRA2]NMD71023.1 DinB family protein [Bacillus sp. DNRA2]
MNQKLDTTEFAPYYAPYVNRVPEGDIIEILSSQLEKTLNFILAFSDDEALFRYGAGKWSVKEVIGHIIDTERIMAYRLLAIARGETVSLPGFDEQLYVKNAQFDQLSVKELSRSYEIVRQSTTQLLKSIPHDAWTRKGLANGTETTVRALAYIIAGHELHHLNIIEKRYISGKK